VALLLFSPNLEKLLAAWLGLILVQQAEKFHVSGYVIMKDGGLLPHAMAVTVVHLFMDINFSIGYLKINRAE
jgi:hypothetical protein